MGKKQPWEITLEKIEVRIAECKKEIANRRKEIRDLTMTASIIKQLESNCSGEEPSGVGDSNG